MDPTVENADHFFDDRDFCEREQEGLPEHFHYHVDVGSRSVQNTVRLETFKACRVFSLSLGRKFHSKTSKITMQKPFTPLVSDAL